MSDAQLTLSVRDVVAGDTELLDTLVQKEAVVPVKSPRDLARRLQPDRRILAITAEDGAPLAFVHVALTTTFPESLDEVLAGPVDIGPPRFATFYGITRVDDRARGRAGDLLIAARDHVLDTVAGIEVASTLSPMPGFRAWVRRTLVAAGRPEADAELDAISRSVAAGLAPPRKLEALRRLAELWLSVKDERGRLQDPVARFHLGNGAHLRAVMVGADASWHGLEQSLGVMMSYRYDHAAEPDVDGQDGSLEQVA